MAGMTFPLSVRVSKEKEAGGDDWALLLHAARNGHLSVLQQLVDSDGLAPSVATDREGNTALHAAVEGEQTEAVDFLLTRGADDSILNADGDAPLHLAVRGGNLRLLEVFVSHPSVDLLVLNGQQQTAIHMAGQSGRVDVTRVLLHSELFRRAVLQDASGVLLQRDKDGSTLLDCSHQEVLDLLLSACKRCGLSSEQVLACLEPPVEGVRKGSPFLRAAVESGNVEVVNVLLKHGASPLLGGEVLGVPSPLQLACIQGRIDIVRSVIECYGKKALEHKGSRGRNLLHFAAKGFGCDVLAYLLETGKVDVNDVDESGQTPLHTAVIHGRLEDAKLLVKHRADPLLKDEHLRTVLHFAVTSSKLELLKYLLTLPEVSRMREEVDRTGDTPLHLAIRNSADELCTMLLEDGALKDVRDGRGNYYLHLASVAGNEHLLGKLLETPLYLKAFNEVNGCGETPLHLAAHGGHVQCVRLLLSRGAYPRRCRDGMTAFLHACSHGHVTTAKVLLDAFPFQLDWNTATAGNTALHLAALSASPATVRFLLDRGCKIVPNSISQSFLEVALERCHAGVVMAALNHKRWQDCLDCHSPQQPHPMLQCIRKMPEAAKLILDRSHERASVGVSHPEYWERFDFKYLRLKSSGGEELVRSSSASVNASSSSPRSNKKRRGADTVVALLEMIEVGQKELLNHPVVNMYIKQKWNSYGFWLYFAVFFLRIILATLVSVFTVLILTPSLETAGLNASNTSNASMSSTDDTPDPQVTVLAQVIRVFALVINLALFIHVVLPVAFTGVYILNVVSNAPLLIYAITLALNFIYLLVPDPLSIIPVGATACFFSWLMVLTALAFFDILGVYVRMFFRVARTVFVMLLLSVFLVLAFSFSLYALVDTVDSFSTVQHSLVSVFFYILGDFHQDELISQDIEGRLRNRVLVFLFLFVITTFLSIVMANVMIGLAVGDIEKIKKNAVYEKKEILVTYFKHIDVIPFLKRFDVQSHTRHPNAKVSKMRQIWRFIWRATKEDAVVEDRGGTLSQETGSLEGRLDQVAEKLDRLVDMVGGLQGRHVLDSKYN